MPVRFFDPAANDWRSWKLPGVGPQAYSVYVDESDKIWLTDFSAHAIVRFDPETEAFARGLAIAPVIKTLQHIRRISTKVHPRNLYAQWHVGL